MPEVAPSGGSGCFLDVGDEPDSQKLEQACIPSCPSHIVVAMGTVYLHAITSSRQGCLWKLGYHAQQLVSRVFGL